VKQVRIHNSQGIIGPLPSSSPKQLPATSTTMDEVDDTFVEGVKNFAKELLASRQKNTEKK